MRLVLLLLPVIAAVLAPVWGVAKESVPPDLSSVLEAKPSRELDGEFGAGMRREAMRASALAYGAQSGLAWRSWEIERNVVSKHAASLDRLYGFRRLTETRHGFTLVPPVVGETRKVVRLGAGRKTCGVGGARRADHGSGASGDGAAPLAGFPGPGVEVAGAARIAALSARRCGRGRLGALGCGRLA